MGAPPGPPPARLLPSPDMTALPAWPPATWQWPRHMTAPARLARGGAGRAGVGGRGVPSGRPSPRARGARCARVPSLRVCSQTLFPVQTLSPAPPSQPPPRSQARDRGWGGKRWRGLRPHSTPPGAQLC